MLRITLWRSSAPGFLSLGLRASTSPTSVRCQHTAPSDKNVTAANRSLPRLLDLKNGPKVQSTFSEEEMTRRIDVLRNHMEENGLVASLFTSYHNINYFSDFLYCSFGRPYALIVTMDKTVSVSANIDGGQPWRRTSLGDNIIYTDWHKDNYYHAIGSVLKDYVGKVGVEYDHVNLDKFKKLEKALPVRPLVDVGEPTMRMRMKKSPEEIALIKEGARIADLGGQACVDAVVEGVGEHEVALAGTQAMVREIAVTFPHAELRDTWVWFQSGLNTDGAHNPVTSRRIQKGDILSLNCFPMIAGYYTALERTLFYDHVTTDRHLELWEINCEVHRKGIELIKPGVRCCDIAAELNDIYKKYDVLQYRTFGYGHSFGTLCHYYGREAGLELREDIETVLEPGMVVSMEPMIMLPEGLPGAGGYREHDILVVTEDGAENITKFPFGPERSVIKN
ncbi:creatinase-like [Ptychodera flava]|uniref:creatinase-like n=1 Tax=Ptychodera flava TaxID=63121 RepID=UPI00396A6FB0